MNDLVSIPKDLEERFDERWSNLKSLGRRTVFATWEVGQALKEAKDVLDEDAWGAFIERKGVSGRSARRFIQLFNGYPNESLEQFGSVDEAIKAIPAPERSKREPAPAASPEPETKPEEPVANLATEPEEEPEPENPAEVELELQRARAEEAEAENEALREKLAMATDGDPDPELAAVEKVRERVAELDAENERLRRSLKHQERKLASVRRDLTEKKSYADILRVRFGIVEEGEGGGKEA